MTQDDSPPPSTRPLQKLSGPILIVALGLALYLPGLRWGLPSVVSWSQDTIAGVRTLGAVDGWPGDWKGRYPPLHYFVLRAAYEPLLAHWTTTGERVVDPDSGKSSLSPPHAPKIGQLTLIARATTVVMAILAGLGLWAAARRLLHDELAACVAAAAMMTGAGFTYFAHLGNVDVPSVCWFAWSVYFYVRLIESRRIADAALLGLFAALAVSTKDAVGGMYPGMALFLLIQEVRYRRRSAGGKAWRSLVQPRWFVGLIAFALPFVIINGLFANPDAYFTRIGGWLDPAPNAHLAHELRHTDFISLAAATLHHAAGAVGWPMLIALAIGVAWT
ncbi:MAG: glycosyltransferase family 39 protein, partial [Planctomycetes bacterium]|nr:glycosyltransferase family 39 protein [Planctomycetota bacterium]